MLLLLGIIVLIIGGYVWQTNKGSQGNPKTRLQGSIGSIIGIVLIIASFIFILTPSLLYISFHEQTENGLSYIDVIAGLWVWLPIEFGLVDDFLGTVEFGNLPFDTLLAFFAFW